MLRNRFGVCAANLQRPLTAAGHSSLSSNEHQETITSSSALVRREIHSEECASFSVHLAVAGSETAYLFDLLHYNFLHSPFIALFSCACTQPASSAARSTIRIGWP